MNKGKRPIGKILMILSVVFFYLPILYMIIFSFNDGKSLTSFTGFSLRWYKHMLESADMMDALSTTFSIALLATFISTVAGTIAAIGVSKSKKLIRDLMEQANNLPIMNPEIVTAIGFMLLFITFHVEKGYVTMLLAHIAFCIPYVMLSVMPKIKSLDPNLADAAMDLGATPWQALTKVVVPQITPGIVAGALIAFTMSVDDFIISYFVTGRGVKNLSIMVYTMSKRVNPSINAISTLVVVIITIVLVIINAAPALFAKRAKRNSIGRRNVLVPAIAVVCALAVVAGVVTYNNKKEPLPFEGQTLRIYNWGEYVGEHIIQDFQKETGATVLLENFDSNEQMYIKVANGEAYDILVPSDYMIQRLISEGYLQKLDKSKLNCMDKLYDAVKGLPYDPENEYSVPYFWGTVGILYDKTVVDEADLKDGWNLLCNPKYKGNIYMYDSERDSFMIALKALGYSMNTTNEAEIEEAYQWLIDQRDTMDPIYAGDDVIDNMISGNKALAVVYSGDASYIISENPNLDYFTPEQGTNRWYDAMVITKDCSEVQLAHEFIDFMISDKSALSNTEEVGYTSTVKSAFETMKEGDYAGISSYIPDTTNPNNEIFAYQQPKIKQKFAELWTKVKAK